MIKFEKLLKSGNFPYDLRISQNSKLSMEKQINKTIEKIMTLLKDTPKVKKRKKRSP
tara:strand:- start:16342 stop:16512 length:171 start_codon:yes stop_codon:yes gene_type:complete